MAPGCECCGCRKTRQDAFDETFVVGDNTQPRGRFGRKEWGGDILEPMISGVSLGKHQQRELALALRAK